MLSLIAMAHLSTLAAVDAFGGTVYVKPSTEAVRLTSEAVTFTIRKDGVSVEARYMFKNLTDVDVPLLLVLPLFAENTNRPFPQNRLERLSATWDKEPLGFAEPPQAAEINELATTYEKPFVASVTFRAKATHVLRVQFSVQPGNDDLHRFVAWRTAGGASWAGRVERADYAFKYDTKSVFHVVGIEPNWGWQWGQTGAYVKRTNFEPTAGEEFRFRYYPPDF
ncbi:MAG: hypothetical protein C4341_05410 [Armatimonadota bacterium]